MFTKKFDVAVRDVLYGVYANVRLADGHCKTCKAKVEFTKLVGIDEIINEDTTERVEMLDEHRLLGEIRIQILKEPMFRQYCEPHIPKEHLPS